LVLGGVVRWALAPGQHLGTSRRRMLRVIGIRDDDADQPLVLIVEEAA
jgi:hypothetical protein